MRLLLSAGPGVSTKNLNDPAWMKHQLTQLDQMMDASLNHASIMTWGWFNEGPSADADAWYAARRSGLRALRAQASRAPCAQANEPRLRPR